MSYKEKPKSKPLSQQTTAWTIFDKIKSGNKILEEEAIKELINIYEYPVKLYYKRKYTQEKAEELTQGFICDKVIEKSFFKKADKNKKGKFRFYLKRALDNYEHEVYRKGETLERHPEGGLASLSNITNDDFSLSASDMKPDDILIHDWAKNLLNTAINQFKEICDEKNLNTHWIVFEANHLYNIKPNAKYLSRSELSKKLHIKPQAISDKYRTIWSHLRKILEEYIELYLRLEGCDDQGKREIIEQEIDDILDIL